MEIDTARGGLIFNLELEEVKKQDWEAESASDFLNKKIVFTA